VKRHCAHCDFKPDGDVEVCTKCGDVFPCQTPCGHSDCWEKKNELPSCPVCKKPVLPEEQFNASGRNGWIPLHDFCFDSFAASRVKSAPPPWNGQLGVPVQVEPSLDATYRDSYGDAIDDMVVEKVVSRTQVLVKGIGMVPTQHIRMKEKSNG